MNIVEAANEFESAAQQLELGLFHYRSVVTHFRQRDVARACAHICAARGHLQAAQKRYDGWLAVHADSSTP